MPKRAGTFRQKNGNFGPHFVFSRTKALVKHPLFLWLTITGNFFMLASAGLFYWVEHKTNPALSHFWDALWWAVQTVTTVGYGDITPKSHFGKFIGMGLMLFGTALFSSYTALFAALLLEPEIIEVEREMRELERAVHPSDPSKES